MDVNKRRHVESTGNLRGTRTVGQATERRYKIHLDKTDNVFEACKRVLYTYRPYGSSGNATGIRVPDSFVPDDDRSFQ